MSETEAFGRYVLEKKLGRGGMAEVFLAHHNDRALYSEPIVIKRVLSHLKENRTFLEMFLREARMVASFSHPNIIKIIDLGKVGSDFFIAMEFVDGLTVDSLGRRFFAQGEPVPVPLVAQLIADAALGLDHVHRARAADGKSPVVHRDISPDNLMVNTDGVTKILDFGIARPEGEENLTKTGVIKGKIPFMPPEQIESKKLDGRTDLYALGVSMFWLLTERRPFDRGTPLLTMSAIVLEAAPPPTRFRPDLPPLVDDIVLALLEKDPELRIPTGAALAEALAPLLTMSRAEVAAVVQRKARESEPPKRRPLLMEQPSDRSQPNETRVVPRRDSPESAMFVARTAVTPSDDRVSPGAVTRATFVGDVAPAIDEHSRTGAFVEGVQRIAPNAETLRFSEAPIVATDAHIAPAMIARSQPSDPAVTVFQPSDGRRSSSTTMGAIAGALVFAAVAAVVVVSLSGGDEPAIAHASASPATSSPSTTTRPPEAPARATEKDLDDQPKDRAPVEAGGQAVVDPVDDDTPVEERAPAEDTQATTGEDLPRESNEKPMLDDDDAPDAPSDRRERDPRDRRRPAQSPGNAAAASASSSSSAASASSASTSLPERETPEPAVEAPKPSKSMRVLSVRAPAHVRFLDGGRRVKPKGNELSVPLSTKSLVAHDTVRDVKTKIPVSDLPIDYDVLPKGTLSIRAVPFAQVYFGKESVGTTPLPSLKVVVGTYKVRLVYEDKEIERVVEVRPGDLTRISENMTK